MEIKQRKAGRIEMVLLPDVSPRAAENFRQVLAWAGQERFRQRGTSGKWLLSAGEVQAGGQ